jgi:hypothetical protein
VPIDAHLVPILRAATARIVPADDLPGAAELHAAEFILGFPEYADAYNAGLAKLPADFDLSTPDAQDSALSQLSSIDPQFFDLLRRQTIEAVLAQPSALWDAMGFVVTA